MFVPAFHCTPNSAARDVLTSTMSASTYTCWRRWSSWSITVRSPRYTGSEAVMMIELVGE
jgi:hypothetical protein